MCGVVPQSWQGDRCAPPLHPPGLAHPRHRASSSPLKRSPFHRACRGAFLPLPKTPPRPDVIAVGLRPSACAALDPAPMLSRIGKRPWEPSALPWNPSSIGRYLSSICVPIDQQSACERRQDVTLRLFGRTDTRVLTLGVDKSTLRLQSNDQKRCTIQMSQVSPTRQIVGFSLSPELARKVKEESARKGISLRKLFEEMWDHYEKEKKKP